MRFFVCLLLFFSFCYSQEDVSTKNRKAVLASIPKNSLRKLLLFATLYPDTAEGKIALQQAFSAISCTKPDGILLPPPFFTHNVARFSALLEPNLFTQQTTQNETFLLSKETCAYIDELSKNLPHKKLKGHYALSLKEIESLDSNEIDLAHALLLVEEELSPQTKLTRDSIESTLDLLALAILARIGKDADAASKIKELNHILFDELALRFPPQSEAQEKAKQFSELSTVLFSRRGICLGASTLYLCLAQRIGLPLAIFTPPGHIFVGYKEGETLRIIETTARGIDIPSEEYLGTNLSALPLRTLKEVIGMGIYNRASNSLRAKNWSQAHALYMLAQRFESDEELEQLIALTELLLDQKKASMNHAQKALQKPDPCKLEHDLLLIDLSKGALSKESAEALIETSNNEPDALAAYIKKLDICVAKDPTSASLHLHLAYCWFMYGKPKNALPYLEKVASFQEAPSSVHFFLAELYASRMNFPAAWIEAKKAALLAKKQGLIPKPLQKFILFLHNQSPNCEEFQNLVL